MCGSDKHSLLVWWLFCGYVGTLYACMYVCICRRRSFCTYICNSFLPFRGNTSRPRKHFPQKKQIPAFFVFVALISVSCVLAGGAECMRLNQCSTLTPKPTLSLRVQCVLPQGLQMYLPPPIHTTHTTHPAQLFNPCKELGS